MCAICGCGTDHDPLHGDHGCGEHGHGRHDHGDHEHGDLLDFGAGPAGLRMGGLSPSRTLRIERDILSKNDALARANRERLGRAGIFALNLMSSPGAGKTSLLVRMIADLKARHAISVIEGDQQTTRDADRIRAAGAPAVQINTGRGCHLDAHMVGHALDRLPLTPEGLLFIENVGNLVCPAAFDLGETKRAVVFSVTEGEDKPLKYPDMFAAADLLLLNKIDLLPHLDFDLGACLHAARRVNPAIRIAPVSARTGAGLGSLYAWIEHQIVLAAPGRLHG